MSEKMTGTVVEPQAPGGLVADLRAACFGRPAKIEWPHRLLHRAADAIELAEMRECVALKNKQNLLDKLQAANARIAELERALSEGDA